MPIKPRPMSKRQFRIGELATALGVEKYVIRFWEKEFQLSTYRSDGGQRFYTIDDLVTFSRIKKLLYNEGFTIAGARSKLQDQKIIKHISPARTDVTHLDTKVAPKQVELLKAELEQWKNKFLHAQDKLKELKKSSHE